VDLILMDVNLMGVTSSPSMEHDMLALKSAQCRPPSG
jgi:hypothetical protein